MKIFVVIPAYNEQKRIGKVLKELKKKKYPIVVIDDGSTDKTLQAAKKYTDLAFAHKTNLGKGAALKTGIDVAILYGADAVILMDADGQHKVSDLPLFIKALRKNEVVIGSRSLNLKMPLIRLFGNKISLFLVKMLFNIQISDLLCGYRAMTKDAYKKINWRSAGYEVETEMITLIGKKKLKFCEVEVETIYHERFKGVTVFDAFFIFGKVLGWRLQ